MITNSTFTVDGTKLPGNVFTRPFNMSHTTYIYNGYMMFANTHLPTY